LAFAYVLFEKLEVPIVLNWNFFLLFSNKATNEQTNKTNNNKQQINKQTNKQTNKQEE
jgi:hypothetical protein